MLEILHRLGSRVRHSRWVRGRQGLWARVEPSWQWIFGRLSRRRGYATRVNQDVFRLLYAYGARYDRDDHQHYERAFYGEFVAEIRPGMTVLDLGAHIGLFTLGAAKRVGPAGRVCAFEPSPTTADVLETHVRMNGWADRVEVVRAAASDEGGWIPFYASGVTMAASVGRQNVEALNPERLEAPADELMVPAVTLDAFCAQKGIVPDVIKIDVEGAELQVLRGAERLLRQQRPAVFCEVHPEQMHNCNASLSGLQAYLDAIGYRLAPMGAPGGSGIFHARVVRVE